MTERRSGLVTRDSKTGLRRNGIRYLDGNPPTPAGCRWCGTREYWHGRRYVASVGWHTWTMPTTKQILARMKARRRVQEAAKVARRFNPAYEELIKRTHGTASWPTSPDDEES